MIAIEKYLYLVGSSSSSSSIVPMVEVLVFLVSYS